MKCLPMHRYTLGHAMPALEKKETDVWCYSVRRQARNGRFKHSSGNPPRHMPSSCCLVLYSLALTLELQ